MKRARILTAVVTGLALAAVALFGGLLHEPSPRAIAAAPAASATDGAVVTQLLAGLAGNDTKAYVAKLERRASTHGEDSTTLLLLGLAYQQRARETGDSRFFTLRTRRCRRPAPIPLRGVSRRPGSP